MSGNGAVNFGLSWLRHFWQILEFGWPQKQEVEVMKLSKDTLN